jgi:hypothetical protein
MDKVNIQFTQDELDLLLTALEEYYLVMQDEPAGPVTSKTRLQIMDIALRLEAQSINRR